MTAKPVFDNDHGGLDGLADNDHPQYPLTAGTETISGDWEFSTSVDFTSGAPQITISNAAPRMEFRDTTATNGDTWYFQGVNANFRIRNFSNSDGELRIEERVDLNRNYDPLTVGSNYNVIDFDPSFTTAGLLNFPPSFVNLSPNVTSAVNMNIVVLRGGGSYDITGGSQFTWSMFRANPVMSTSVAAQTMPSPNVFDNQMTYGTEADVANARSGRFVGFHDRGNISVFDGTSAAQTLMNEYTSFLAAATSTNEGSGLINITEVYGLKVEGAGLASGRDSYWGIHIGNAAASVVENVGIEIAAQGSSGSGFDKEIYITAAGGIYFRDTAGGIGIESDATDDMRIFATADVLIDSASLAFSGLLASTPTTVTGTTHTAAAEHIILCDDDAAAAAITVTLPLAATADAIYRIKKLGSTANVTVDGNGTELIDDALTAVLTAQYESIDVASDGSAWWIL